MPDLSRLKRAIAMVESNDNTNAVNGRALGHLQIRPPMVEDFNKWTGKSYKHEDMKDRQKAEEVFDAYISHYDTYHRKVAGRPLTEREIAGLWNQGYTGTKKYPQEVDKYFGKVQKELSLLPPSE